MICKRILLATFLNEPEVIFCAQLYGFKYFYLLPIICLCTKCRRIIIWVLLNCL